MTRAAVAVARALDRVIERRAHRDQVVAVDLHAFEAGGDAFLRERLRRRSAPCAAPRSPTVVDDDARPAAAVIAPVDVDRAVEIALRRAAVADDGDRDARFLADLERERGAGSVQALRRDRHATRRNRAPVRKNRCRARRRPSREAPRAASRRDRTARRIRGTSARTRRLPASPLPIADMRGLVAEARRIGAELAGALQGDRLAVEHAHEHHQLVQLDELLDVVARMRAGRRGRACRPRRGIAGIRFRMWRRSDTKRPLRDRVGVE